MMRLSSAAWIGLLCDLLRDAFVLAHDVVALQPGDDGLDVRILVAGVDGELMRLGAELLVFSAGQADALDARSVAALADEVEGGFEVERLGKILDPLVDLPKDG